MLTAPQFEEFGETLVDRAGIAKLLKISPNRVSELVRLGVFSPCTDDSRLFPYPHCNSCYQDYMASRISSLSDSSSKPRPARL